MARTGGIKTEINLYNMTTIHGFSTKKEGWQKDLLNKISEQSGSVRLPFEADGMVVEKDPFEGVDKSVLEPLTYSKQ